MQKVDNKIFHDEDSIDEEEEESEVVDEDRPLQIVTTLNNNNYLKNSIQESQMISSCQDYNFLGHLQEFSSGTNVFESVICHHNAPKRFNFVEVDDTPLEQESEK